MSDRLQPEKWEGWMASAIYLATLALVVAFIAVTLVSLLER
jgi:hypothetical protein